MAAESSAAPGGRGRRKSRGASLRPDGPGGAPRSSGEPGPTASDRERSPRAEPAAESATAPGAGAPSEAGAGDLSFEEAFALAEGAVDTLERGSLSLQESLRQYEEGLRALNRCYEVLGSAERRIEVLAQELGSVSEGDEGPVWISANDMPGLREGVEAADRDAARPIAEDGTTDGEAGERATRDGLGANDA